MAKMTATALKVTLRQLVRYDNKGREFYRGRSHIWRLDHGRTFCGRSKANWGMFQFEPSSLPYADCITCLDRFAKWKCKLRGEKYVKQTRASIQLFARATITERTY